MSSTLSIINWTPTEITVTLNRKQFPPIKTSKPGESYYPYNLDVTRVSGTPKEGEWGDVNNLYLTSPDNSQTQIYNSLKDPEGARVNITLMLWVFPGSCVFSQIGEKLETVTPEAFEAT